VLGVITIALARIGQIKARLGIETPTPEAPVEDQRQPADVLVALIRCNRELSRCLERPFTPEDVYRQVTLATVYGAALLGGRGRAVPAAAYEGWRKPADCYSGSRPA
jgi:hypothetical protein